MTESKTNLDPQDTRQRLLLAAGQVFASKGFEAASVREICQLAHVNIASINYYFGGPGGKERLYIEAVKLAHKTSSEGEEIPEWPPGTPPAIRLRDFIRCIVSRMFAPADPACFQLVMRELAFPSLAAQEVVREFIQPMAHTLREIIAELLPLESEDVVLMHGFSVIGQILYYRQNRPVSEMLFGKEHVDALTLDGVTRHITRFTFRAMGLEIPPEGQP
jgi:AcrR family transcriptional regulator